MPFKAIKNERGELMIPQRRGLFLERVNRGQREECLAEEPKIDDFDAGSINH